MCIASKIATGLYIYPLKTENQRFSDAFRGYRKISGMKWVKTFQIFVDWGWDEGINPVRVGRTTALKTLSI